MLIRVFSYIGVAIAFFFWQAKFPIEYQYVDFKDYLNLLASISGMVFTIMGIWIAFLYPNALSRLVSPGKIAAADFSETLEDTKRLENIVAAVLTSALVMVAALAVTFAKITLHKAPLFTEHTIFFKGAALSILLVMTMVQIEAVFSVVLANVRFINELHRKRNDRQAEETY